MIHCGAALAVISVVVTVSFAYPSGAPAAACSTLAPVHAGITPQNSVSPYSITANDTLWMSGSGLTVMISGGDINGFILQAVSGSDMKTPIGSFDGDMLPPLTQTGPCEKSGAPVSVTHTSSAAKTNLKFIWKAPEKSDYSGTIFFKAAVATDHDTYWADIKSVDIMHRGTTTQTIGGGDGDGDEENNPGQQQVEDTTPNGAGAAVTISSTLLIIINSMMMSLNN